jgi:hypothetical protein
MFVEAMAQDLKCLLLFRLIALHPRIKQSRQRLRVGHRRARIVWTLPAVATDRGL